MDSVDSWSTSGKGCGYGLKCSPTGPVRGLCPAGWHLPSKAEWETLFAAVGGVSIASIKLKSTSGWNNSFNGSDEFGFTALPAGVRSYKTGYYYEMGEGVYYWSFTEDYTEKHAYTIFLGYDYEDASSNYYYKNFAFSVRCVKD